MNYGYARCSTNESKQDIHRQIKELKAAGAETIVFEYEHGDAKIKKELESLLEAAQPGDTLITTEVSRLSRSTQQLCEIVHTIKTKRLRLMIVGSITVDCRNGEIDPMSQAFIQMCAVFAELELSIIRARVKSGMANAKKKQQGGHPCCILEALSGLCEREDECKRAGAGVRGEQAHGV